MKFEVKLYSRHDSDLNETMIVQGKDQWKALENAKKSIINKDFYMSFKLAEITEVGNEINKTVVPIEFRADSNLILT